MCHVRRGASNMDDGNYRVYSPLGNEIRERVSSSLRPSTLNEQTVAFIWDYLFKGPEFFAAVRECVLERFPTANFVDCGAFGDIHGPDVTRILDELPRRLAENNVDLAVVAVGACGSCMPAVIRAAAVVERAGVPTVAIGATQFEALGRTVAEIMGVPDIPIVVYPGVPLSDTSEDFARKVRDHVAPAVVEELIGQADLHEEGFVKRLEGGQDTAEIVTSGSLDEIQDYFLRRLWTDGLPIIPPTPERVEAFLCNAQREPSEVLGILLPERREATVHSVAVNAVMAGCRPEYFPLLLAVVECIADPLFRIEDAGSTPGWEPIVIVSGPLANQLGFNSGAGALRIGRQANSSVGRFLRLYLRNVAGFLTPPGTTDQGAIAGNFYVALAENDDFIRSELNWPTYREDHGYTLDESVIGVQSLMSAGVPIYSSGDSAEEALWSIARCFADTLGLWGGAGYRQKAWYPLLVMCPSVAKALNGFGLTKSDLRQYLFDNVLVNLDDTERFLAQIRGIPGGTSGVPSIPEAARLVGVPGREAVDANGMLRAIVRPDWIQVVVAGNPGRNQSKAFVQQNQQGPPVTRKVDTTPVGSASN
jgi:hypothetical protein